MLKPAYRQEGTTAPCTTALRFVVNAVLRGPCSGPVRRVAVPQPWRLYRVRLTPEAARKKTNAASARIGAWRQVPAAAYAGSAMW
jgi:hypothetical protein